ncbi:ATP-binding cassette domain-containing protein [Rickettsia endosymbiont of Cardiosporidium cionae]|uniref:ATP-binding cassette domain-containing protein n=1 Tax=Rickettsia endosymbiont of Cardiosporidium cionae TaxID=2777155 RepID=UPI00189448BD|nr:ATP-binding cassette domain-containing protein [Rickettsia endosymbiont of Cardiosporidium cionae]KAF8818212.1 methionine ABC transporter ATP-binding protein [Rickettsia endosymbiont of Cardiosporidium cionae]
MLELYNVKKSFKAGSIVLNNINLSITKGEFVVIIGNNGSGKSTLMKIISGEYSLDSGQIFLDTQRIDKKSLCERSAMISGVAQDVTKGTVSGLSMLENIAVSNIRGLDAKFVFYKKNIDKIIESIKNLGLGLEKFLMDEISILSLGQRQAVATFMSLYPIPKLLLLDEHTSALDIGTSSKIMQYTSQQIEKHIITTLMVTHNIDYAIKYGNRLIVMDSGCVVVDINASAKKNIKSQDIVNYLYGSPKC